MTDTPNSDIQPADEGLSLEELSEAYAEVLQQGNDPYQDRQTTAGDLPVDSMAGEPEEESSSMDDCEVTPRSILEAILFVGHPHNEPLTSEKIAALMRGVRAQEIDELVCQLNEAYVTEGSPYIIKSIGAGYSLTLRKQWASLRERFHSRVREARLSQAAIDVLAIVAYHQPLTRQQVDEYRTKGSSNILRQLVRRNLLCIQRSEEHPRISRFRTTDRFLDLFGLQGLDDLPQSHELDGDF